MKQARNFAVVAGETSGDLLASSLLQACQQRWPGLHAFGIGGPRMAAVGFSAQWPSEKLAVRGYVEVLKHYREIVGIRRQLKHQLLDAKPDLFIGVDAPDFNLDLELDLRSAGVPTVHFVSPSIWAWRPERIHKIARAVNHVLCIFPFETEIYARQGVPATYVGHPLASAIPMAPNAHEAKLRLQLDPERPVVAILPGSRVGEIEHIAPRFLKAVALMSLQRPEVQFVLPAVPHLKNLLLKALSQANVGAVVRLIDGQSHTALAACDVTMIASGTATLEAALFKKPMVIGYAMPALSWWLTQRKKMQPWVGLPNILSQDFVVPELLQDACTPEALAEQVLGWLDAPQRVDALKTRFAAMHALLLRDTPRLCTDAIATVLGEAP